MVLQHALSLLSHVHPFNFSNHPWTILNLMTNNSTTKKNMTCTRAFLRNMPWSFAVITYYQSSFSFICSPTYFVLLTRIIVLDLQSTKILSRFLHPLISPKTLSMHRNNISFFISIKFTQINSFFQLRPSLQNRTEPIKHTQIHAFETKIFTYLSLTKPQRFLL